MKIWIPTVAVFMLLIAVGLALPGIIHDKPTPTLKGFKLGLTQTEWVNSLSADDKQ